MKEIMEVVEGLKYVYMRVLEGMKTK